MKGTELSNPFLFLRRRLPRFAFSLIAVAIGLAVRIILRPALGNELAFVTFYPAVFLAAVVGGLWPGVVAAVASAVVVDYVVILPVGSFTIAKTSDAIGMGIFLVTGCSIGALSEVLHRTKKRTEELNTQLKLEIVERRHADEKNALLAAIVSSSDLAIISQTPEGIVASWNRGAENLFGYTCAEAIGRPISLIIPPDQPQDEANILDGVRDGRTAEQLVHLETVRRHKNGDLIDVSVTASPVHDPSGRVIGGSKILLDIGDRKRAEEQLRLIVEWAPSAMVMIKPDGCIALVNAQAELLFGYKRHELHGQAVEVLLPSRFRGNHPVQRAAFFAQPSEIQPGVRSMGLGRDLFGRRKDGSEFPIEVGLNPIHTKEGRMVLSAIVDISDRKREDERKRKFHEMLEIQVKERTAELRAANEALGQFAYAASHDLKAPLRVIDNCSKWIEEDLRPYLTGDTRENMHLLRARVKRMDKLLDDLLDYARIGQMDGRCAEKIAGDALMQNIVELLAPARFAIDVSPNFAGIRVCVMPLQQILMNLISNAIKHHDKPRGSIDVTVEDRGEFYEFAVKDDGPGIAPRFHERIFQMFQTLKPKDQVEGSGMGLAMVRRNVEVFGGTIHLESDEGEGCTFRFVWPKIQRSRKVDLQPAVDREPVPA